MNERTKNGAAGGNRAAEGRRRPSEGRGRRRVWIKTFGCQQNEADSEKLLGICELCGYTPTDDPAQADLILINTCAIREHAELRALSGAGQLKKLKADKPGLLIAVCGCMVEQEHRRRQLFASYPYVDFLFGTDRLHLLPELLERAGREKKRFAVTASQPGGDFGVISEGLPFIGRAPTARGCR